MANFDKSQLRPYKNGPMVAHLIPIHPWNKTIKGKERGKTPVDKDWTTRPYDAPGTLKLWLSRGFNLGYRVPENRVVIDIDPRNFTDDIDTTGEILKAFNVSSFTALAESAPVVRTGGGGYHIYCRRPDTPHGMNEIDDWLPGVEIKQHGRQVLIAGSKHPNGKFYTWLDPDALSLGIPPVDWMPAVLTEIYARKPPKHSQITEGHATITGAALQECVLDHLDVTEFDSNDTWWTVLCGCHYATGGQGVEEFTAWSLEDADYLNSENEIRSRWQSLQDKENSITAASLIHVLQDHDEPTNGLRAALDFADLADNSDTDLTDYVNPPEDGETVAELAEKLDPDTVTALGEGADMAVNMELLLETIKDLSPSSGVEDRTLVLHLMHHGNIGAAQLDELEEAFKAATKMVPARYNRIRSSVIKEIRDKKLSEDEARHTSLAHRLYKDTLKWQFENGTHVLRIRGVFYQYIKTHWVELDEGAINGAVLRILAAYIVRLEKNEEEAIPMREASLVRDATYLVTSRLSHTAVDPFNPLGMPRSIINCQNGQVHVNQKGQHRLKPHKAKSYLRHVLPITYDKEATCPLFMRTLREIFADNFDCDEIIRHVLEVIGYIMQPDKNIAVCVLFHGLGGDGKSTILNIIAALLGPMYVAQNANILTGGFHQDNHATASLVGKLTIGVPEFPAGGQLDDTLFKMLSESAPLHANPKGRQPFTFWYVGTPVICSNHYPRFRDNTDAMLRRMMVVPFRHQFGKRKNDADLSRARDIVKDPEEMAGILNLALAGLKRLRARGNFDTPLECIEALATWRGQANPLLGFMYECTEKVERKKMLLPLVFDSYNTWCDQEGIGTRYRVQSIRSFAKHLREQGILVRKSTGNKTFVFGFRLTAKGLAGIKQWEV